MAKKEVVPSAPFSFEVEPAIYGELEKLRRGLGNPSLRVLIELALGRLEGSEAVGPKEKRHQVSVRLAPSARAYMQKIAKKRSVSAGEVVRAALSKLLESPPSEIDATQTKGNMAKKKSAKKAVKKAAPKKAAVKKTAKKATKEVAKKAAVKKTAKKAAAKKVAKKAPAKKAAAKKATKKAAAEPTAAPVAEKKVVKKVAKKAAKRVAKKK